MVFLSRNFRSLQEKQFFLFMLVFCFIFVWRCWFLSQEIQDRYLQVTVNTPLTETAQLYYDQGYGFNEHDSVVALPIHNTSNRSSNKSYQFQLTPAVIYAMRFVPAGSSAGVEIQHIDILDGLGLHLRTIDSDSLQIVSSATSSNIESHDKEHTLREGKEKQQINIFF